MNSEMMKCHDKTSPLKRRRFISERVSSSRRKKNVISEVISDFNQKNNDEQINNVGRCDSPHLPCNQVEYLFDSANTSICSDVPQSTDISYIPTLETSESLAVGMKSKENCTQDINKDLEDLSDEMFCSKLNQSVSNHVTIFDSKKKYLCNERVKSYLPNEDLSKLKVKNVVQDNKNLEKFVLPQDDILQDTPKSNLSRCLYERNVNNNKNKVFKNEDFNKSIKTYKHMVEDSFDFISQSISNFNTKKTNKIRQNETKYSVSHKNEDQLTLKDDIKMEILKEHNIEISINQPAYKHKIYDSPRPVSESNNEIIYSKSNKLLNNNTFYGLPIATKDLFKTYRKIEKFYDWQEECLNLSAIKDRRNLVYALPTSGGKTLVAEVLMLREVLNRKKNALFILPYVAIVQEKIWALSPFAVQLDFLLEEYAGGKGTLPPKKRRKKNSIYIATIEKGLALVRSLIELKRLDELGLIVVDELHLIGEKGRGGALETLLTTIIFTTKSIQIVGMSATIGNLDEVATFLRAEVFERQFRPVELTEYVKLANRLYRINWSNGSMDVTPDRELAYNYTKLASSMDPDLLGGLVSEVVPDGSCLVFCPTKRNCENVVALLCKLQRKEMVTHRKEERAQLEGTLRAEGSAGELVRAVRFGIAYHHAGLASDERLLLENAFRSGVISVLCCTSTLAAGVNLPARRVVVRAPFVASRFLTLAAYRQMVGRAGRAGVCQTGESIIICSGNEWERLQAVLSGGVEPATSSLQGGAGLVLGAVALGLASTRADVRRLLSCTFLAVAGQDDGPVDIDKVCDDAICSLVKSGGLEIDEGLKKPDTSDSGTTGVHEHTVLTVSKLARAAIKGCMDLSTAKQLIQDLTVASRSLVLMGSLHLLYLVTPHDAAGVRPDYRHYYSLYCGLDEEGLQTAKVLGINEVNAIRMMTGKEITNVPDIVLRRFYLALMLHDLWKQMPLSDVAAKYLVSRGVVQTLMQTSSSLASSAQRLCEELEPLWGFAALLGELAPRLRHCAAPDLLQLLELPAVKKARALQLVRAGYKRVEDIAKARPEDLVASITHLSRTAAGQLISAARMMLIEKVENLRADAEDVIEELNL